VLIREVGKLMTGHFSITNIPENIGFPVIVLLKGITKV